MDLRDIEIFLAVCDNGGFTAAGHRLGISQAAVSQRITHLERSLGILLFDRSGRQQRLMPAGALLYEKGRRVLGEMEQLGHELERFRDSALPELKVGVIESIALAIVPALVPELRAVAGMVSIVSGVVGPLVPELLRGDIDVIVTSEQIDDLLGLECHTLIREPFVLLLPKGIEPPREPADLARLGRSLTFVRYGSRRQMGPLIDRQLKRFGVELPRTIDFASSLPVVDLVKQGVGWSILTPLCLFSARAEPGDLTIAPLPGMDFSRHIQLAAATNRYGDLPRQMARVSTEALERNVAPKLKAYAPFAADKVVVGPA